RQQLEASLAHGIGSEVARAAVRLADGDQPGAAAALPCGDHDGAPDPLDLLHRGLDVGEDHQEAVPLDAQPGAAEDLDIAVGADPRQVPGLEPLVVAARIEAPRAARRLAQIAAGAVVLPALQPADLLPLGRVEPL